MQRLLLLLGLSVALFASSAPAGVSAEREAGAASLVGAVLTQHGAAVPGAHVVVEVTTPAGRVHVERTTTDAHGRFAFRTLPPGHARVAAFHERAGRGMARVTLQRGHTSRVQIVLH